LAAHPKTMIARRLARLSAIPCDLMHSRLAEEAGFEPADRFYPIAALAKRCYRPLSHPSCLNGILATPRACRKPPTGLESIRLPGPDSLAGWVNFAACAGPDTHAARTGPRQCVSPTFRVDGGPMLVVQDATLLTGPGLHRVVLTDPRGAGVV